VECVSEFDLNRGAAITVHDIRRSFTDREQLSSVRETLASIHGAIESILYNTSLAFGESLPPERILEIGDAVRVLEKDTLRLGSAVSLENVGTAE
jgi:hypothetical protein